MDCDNMLLDHIKSSGNKAPSACMLGLRSYVQSIHRSILKISISYSQFEYSTYRIA